MKKHIVGLLFGCVLICGYGVIASADNQYYTVDEQVDIVGNEVYTVTLSANEGWKWNIADNMDVTSWLVDEHGNPAFTDAEGIGVANLVYGTAEGEEEEVPTSLKLTVDASKISGFSHNGSYELFFKPTGKSTIWVTGENHGQYQDSAEQIGEVVIPEVRADGMITGNANGELELIDASVELQLVLEGIDDTKIDDSNAVIELLDGDGYLTEQYEFEPGSLSGNWNDGVSEYSFGNISGTFSPQGGDGNGHYDFRIGINGLTYNRLPLSQVVVRTDFYTYGRTFSVDGGSIIRDTEPVWTSQEQIPVLCDAYPDVLQVKWPVSYDASALTPDDISLTLVSAYGDELVLNGGEDFVIDAQNSETRITLDYIYWAYAPVYTTLRVEINTGNVNCDELMYEKPDVFSYDYEIASVYVYSVMSGGPTGTQSWTYFGFENLTEPSQVFKSATYTLVWTDEEGNTAYYGEDESGNGVLVSEAADAKAFNCDEECGVRLEGHTVSYDRLYNQTEMKQVDGKEITFEKSYYTAEALPKAISELEGMVLTPGFALGESWEDHLKWPWQSFIGTGFQGGTK
ncbi:hypothetical protein NXH76_25220 [Blautia schinkii]|nr:hypothetical protein [Blautia schinkii]